MSSGHSCSQLSGRRCRSSTRAGHDRGVERRHIVTNDQRTDHPPTFVVGFDFEEHSINALDQALRLAGQWASSRLIIVTAGSSVLERQDDESDQDVAARVLTKLGGTVKQRIGLFEERGLRIPEPELSLRVTEQPAADALRQTAFLEGADVIVVGTSKKSALKGMLGGSVTRDLMTDAPCSVLVCRERADADIPQIDPPRADEGSHLGRRHTYHYESRVGQPGVTWPLLVPMGRSSSWTRR